MRGARESARGKGRYEERRAESATGRAKWERVANDKGEGERKREWNTTSTIATRKFDFQIGVAQANGPREEGRSPTYRVVVHHIGVRVLEGGNV